MQSTLVHLSRPTSNTTSNHLPVPVLLISHTYTRYLSAFYKVNNDDAGSRDLTLVQSIGDTMGAIAISSCKGVLHDKACAMLNCKADLIRSIRFNAESQPRGDKSDTTRLDLRDVGRAPTVTEMENGQRHECSDDQLDWIRKQGNKNYEDNPHKDERLSRWIQPTNLFSIDVLIDENGGLETDGKGEWKRVWEGYGVDETYRKLGGGKAYLQNMEEGAEILFPTREGGSRREISAKFIKVTIVYDMEIRTMITCTSPLTRTNVFWLRQRRQ